MYNVTLISTKHADSGLCNSVELHKIIEKICPEVIFLEADDKTYSKYDQLRFSQYGVYSEKLEISAIQRYSENHNFEYIPVENHNNIPDSFIKSDLRTVFETVENLNDINGHNYRVLSDKNCEYVRMYGFQYCNNSKAMGITSEIADAVQKGLQTINNEKLSKIYKNWLDINEYREDAMLLNIYNYSKQKKYNQAVFLLGYAHRKSIIEKIKKYEPTENFKLNWTFYNDK
ncbi:hypothetical protein FW774_00905 (plasmid) [Pedobacter sp. BS3]|uniref:hypothetical protein n=1 Tax=Pedobacter sp. BS3 TaxID=2567937 RepID=UPI0011EDB132|nr:hypothetical protein [Pedobacter sp. BS3]TZF85669.1 hypothetical protein FW774_00905 [Pedobacter sp. BS3]